MPHTDLANQLAYPRPKCTGTQFTYATPRPYPTVDSSVTMVNRISLSIPIAPIEFSFQVIACNRAEHLGC